MTKQVSVFGAGLLVGAGLMFLPSLAAHLHAANALAHSASNAAKGTNETMHTQRTFEFTVKLPMEAAAPLFGADKERVWAPGWDPAFLWPVNGKDQRGMVFTVAHGQKTAIWIAPTYDLAAGSIQYAYVIPDVMVTLITLKLTPRDQWTHVQVQYERTALSADARNIVLRMAEHDGQSGPEWEKQISDYLDTASK